MQPVTARTNTMIVLVAASIASAAVLLYVSIERNFLPGMVELTTALVLAAIFGAVTLVPRRARNAMMLRLEIVQVGSIRFLAAAVGFLVLTAVLALLSENFPWPAGLLVVVTMLLFAYRKVIKPD
jgi:hypothetical protein